MEINLSIENYRCFPKGHPLSLTLKKGSSAFVGVNNSGKSTLLKFFYEMRSAFGQMGTESGVLPLIGGGKMSLQAPPEILDRDEMFFNGNRDDIDIEVGLTGIDATLYTVTKTLVRVERSGNGCTA